MNTRSIERLKRADRYLGGPFLRLLTLARRPSPGDRDRTPDPGTVRSILMAKLWGIGNLVMILPLVRGVRRAFPDARIFFLTLEENAALLAPVRAIDGLVLLKPEGVVRTLAALARTAREVRRLRPELFLDFEQFLRVTAILARLSGAPFTVGFHTPGQSRAWGYTVKVPCPEREHMRLGFGKILHGAGISTARLPLLEAPRSPAAARRAEEFLRAHTRGTGPLVALHPGSGDNFPGRRWPVERFARLARDLVLRAGARCVLTGSAAERPLVERCRALAGVPAVPAAGRLDLPAFIELLARVDLLVTNDTAPAHIGAALGTPMVALYGPNTPERYGPLHPGARVFHLGLPCSPCLTNANAKTSRCTSPECMLGIDAEDVFRAALELLESVKAERVPLRGEES